MLRFLLPLAVLLLASALNAQPPEKDRLEKSVDRALAFLKVMQEKNGSWQLFSQEHTAVTGLAVMAFLSAGHVPGEGPYGDVVERGVKWILKQQRPSGVISSDEGLEMYHHGICTLMLAEVAGMTDADTAKEVRRALKKAVEVILKAQVRDSSTYQGGWRYRTVGSDADLSVSGWQVLALRAARNVGCDIPAERIDQALAFLGRCRDASTAGYCYMPGHRVTKACTGTAILLYELAGKDHHRSRESLQAGAYLIKHPLEWNDEHFFYTTYYVSQGMFQLGQNYWGFFQPRMHKILFAYQQNNGSWLGSDGYGPVYATSMAVLALTVEYRLLPIYQRHEEKDEGRK